MNIEIKCFVSAINNGGVVQLKNDTRASNELLPGLLSSEGLTIELPVALARRLQVNVRANLLIYFNTEE